MACGACAKAKARRKATLERRRAAERAKRQEEKLAKAAAAQSKQRKLQTQQVAPAPDSFSCIRQQNEYIPKGIRLTTVASYQGG